MAEVQRLKAEKSNHLSCDISTWTPQKGIDMNPLTPQINLSLRKRALPPSPIRPPHSLGRPLVPGRIGALGCKSFARCHPPHNARKEAPTSAHPDERAAPRIPQRR